jgi:hypothetical protein
LFLSFLSFLWGRFRLLDPSDLSYRLCLWDLSFRFRPWDR